MNRYYCLVVTKTDQNRPNLDQIITNSPSSPPFHSHQPRSISPTCKIITQSDLESIKSFSDWSVAMIWSDKSLREMLVFRVHDFSDFVSASKSCLKNKSLLQRNHKIISLFLLVYSNQNKITGGIIHYFYLEHKKEHKQGGITSRSVTYKLFTFTPTPNPKDKSYHSYLLGWFQWIEHEPMRDEYQAVEKAVNKMVKHDLKLYNPKWHWKSHYKSNLKMVRIYSNSRIYLSEGIISTFENCSIWTRNWLLLDEQLSKVKIYLEHVPSLYSLIKFFVIIY